MSIGEAIRRARQCPCEKCQAWAKYLENINRKAESKIPSKLPEKILPRFLS